MSITRFLGRFRSGAYGEAAQLDFDPAELLAAQTDAKDIEDRFDLIRLRGWYHFLHREFDHALTAQREAFSLKPDLEGICNIGILARNLRNRQYAVDFLLCNEDRYGDAHEFLDVLAHNCGLFGDLSRARQLGTRSLELKHQGVKQLDAPLKLPPVPSFDPQTDRNIIAFSLFGANPRYVQPLLVSADVRPHLYPLWTIRIYVDNSVPAEIVRTFRTKGCQVIETAETGIPGTFWRFLVADDAAIDRYIVRDADSILNIRERVAVDAWIASDRHFHVMRDSFSHSELILAGLWGGTRGALPPMRESIRGWLTRRKAKVYNKTTIDQIFLREEHWRVVRHSALIHDSAFDFGDKVDFPTVGTLPPRKHVGQDDFIFFRKTDQA